MQWVIKLMTDWAEAQGYLTTSFVDRGDPAAVDFGLGDLSADGIVHPLDLSGIVPLNAKAVLLNIVLDNTGTDRFAIFRNAANSNLHNITELYTQVAGVTVGQDCTVPLDGTAVIEYLLFPVGWNKIEITVKGWWL